MELRRVAVAVLLLANEIRLTRIVERHKPRLGPHLQLLDPLARAERAALARAGRAVSAARHSLAAIPSLRPTFALSSSGRLASAPASRGASPGCSPPSPPPMYYSRARRPPSCRHPLSVRQTAYGCCLLRPPAVLTCSFSIVTSLARLTTSLCKCATSGGASTEGPKWPWRIARSSASFSISRSAN